MTNAQLAAAVAAVLATGCLPRFEIRTTTSGWIDGADHVIIAPGATDVMVIDDTLELAERAVVADEAAREFGCTSHQIGVEQPYKRAFIATGCGQRGAFTIVTVSIWHPHATPATDEVWYRAVDLAATRLPPPTPYGSVRAPVNGATSTWTDAQRWRQLVQQGAADLACPPDQLTPDFIPQRRAPVVPVVEGCGKRATYVEESDTDPMRLTAVVPTHAPAVL